MTCGGGDARVTRARAGQPPAMRDIVIRGDVIRLGQLLKLADVADSGADAKQLLADGNVTVNDEPEARRGRQVRRGDVVVAAGVELRAV
jgi:ribosome-associated protein